MVFEHLAAFFVDKFLGNYIEDFDSHQLKIHLWDGDITLNNLHLKTNALNDMNVPVQIVTGYLEKLKIHIPWTHLYSHPTKIQLDGLYLLLSLKTDVNYSPEQAEKEEYQTKMKQVNKVEEFRRQREEYELNKSNPHHKDTFFERLQFHILRNLEIEIQNIHIAFDDKTIKHYPFQFGITLKHIKLYVGEINNLSIYWNSNIKSRLDLNKDQILENLKLDKQTNYPKMNYILQPLNARAKLKIAKTAQEQDFEEPVLDAQIDLEEICFNINQNEYSDLLDLLEYEDYINMKKKTIKYHSILDLHEDQKLAKRRWKFAFEVILNESVRPRLSTFKWENIKQNLQRYKEYHQLYLDQLNHTFIKQHKHKIQELEKQIDIFNLIYIRRISLIEHQKKQIEDKQLSWWDKLSNWWNDEEDTDKPEFRLNESISNEERIQFYEAIGYKDKPSSNDIIYPEEYLDINLKVKFNLIEINLWSLINKKDSNFKVIARASIPNTQLGFQRRPARDDLLLILDCDSFEMYGINSDDDLSRPILIKPFKQSNSNDDQIIHLEFETNPVNTNADYRLKGSSQSLQITYHAITVNKLIEAFLSGRDHDLEGIKEAALSIYTDIKNQTQFLVSENLKRIKDLDINIHLQPIYFIIPEYGTLKESYPLICFDTGHLTFKAGNKNLENIEQNIFDHLKRDENDSSWVPIEIQLENIQLLYLNERENWIEDRLKQDSQSHLIKPTTLRLDVAKSVIIDDPQIPIWKANGKVSPVEASLSDTRLYGVLKLICTIPLPTSIEKDQKEKSKKSLPKDKNRPPSTKQTYETIEKMTPIKKILDEEEEEDEKQSEINLHQQQQMIQLKGELQIPKINILFSRSLLDLSDYTEEFVRISFLGIVASTKIETYDIQFNGYLEDFQIIHEQFLTDDQKKLKFLSKKTNSNFFTMNCLLTSTSNPQFASSPYHSIENNIHIELNSIILNIQLEALVSIIHFKTNITNKLNHLPKNKTIKSNPSKPQPSSPSSPSSSPSFKINFSFDQIVLLIGNSCSQILYLQLKSLNGFLSKTNIQLSSHLVLNDLNIIDLYPKSFYQYIITKENQSNDLINLDLSLYSYPVNFKKIEQNKNSFIKGQLQKLNIVFLYKHIHLFLSIIKSFQNNNKQEQKTSSNEPTFISSILQKCEGQSVPLTLDLTLNAPQILIPLNSHSTQGINIDLGKLIMHTDNDNSSTMEKHQIKLEDLKANRIILNKTNQISLLESSPFIISIDRNLNSNNEEDNQQISINIQWDNIQFKLGKSDYATFQKILQQNLKEKIFFQIPEIENNDHEEQDQDLDEQQQQDQSSIVVQKKESSTNKISSPQIRLDFQIKQIGLALYLDQSNTELIRDQNTKFIYLTIEMIEAVFQQYKDSTYKGQFLIKHLFGDNPRLDSQTNQFSRFINTGFQVEQDSPLLKLTLNNNTTQTKVNGQMESLTVLISSDTINSMIEFVIYEIPSSDEKNCSVESSESNVIELNIPSPAKSISLYKPFEHRKSSSKSLTTNDQPKSRQVQSSSSDGGVETNVQFDIKRSQFVLIEDENNKNSNCLVFNFSMSMRLVNHGDDTKISSSIKDLSFYGTDFNELKDSKVKYSIIDPSEMNAMIMINSSSQKIDLRLGDLSINIDPILLRTFASLSDSIKKQEESKSSEGKEEVNSKSIFIPKPFKDSTFWFIQDPEEKKEIMEETDILELTTGDPSKKTTDLKQKDKEKSISKNPFISQQLIVNLKIIEIKVELGTGSSTRPVIALCLSEIFGDIQNWSSDILIYSSIQFELALFNDHLLAWEPLIEPIINERGIVQSPWTISCQTIQDQRDENDQENRYLLNDDDDNNSKDSLSEAKSLAKEGGMDFDLKKLIYIRAEHLLNLTLTKTTLELVQRLQKMFNDLYQKGISSDDDQQQSILSIHNQTGYLVYIDQIQGIEIHQNEKDKQKENSIKLKNGEELKLTIPDERLTSTHLPAIAEQVAKRKQQFQLKIEDKSLTVDINQTWRRVYDISPSSNPSWPIQLLCDSHIHQERRRIIISSIIKVLNRTEMPLILLDAHSIETNQFNRVKTIDPNDEFYLPIELLYLRITPRLYFAIQQNDYDSQINDFISFDWSNESITDRVLKLNDGKLGHFVIYKEEIEAYEENTDEPIRKSFNIYVKLALHMVNLLPIDIQCSIDNIEKAILKPSEIYHSTQGHKKSLLTFTIPSYNNSTWISDQVDLNEKGHGIHNERIVKFNDQITNEILRMVVRVDTYRGSYRISFYSPFWIVNSTDLKFQFKIENDKTFVDVVDQPYFICPKKFDSESHKKKGHIRLFAHEEDETVSQWSEEFSLDVIKSTGITNCKVNNDRNYMVTINIVTSSFGMTKIVTLAPSTAIINNATIDIEVSENPSETGDDHWKLVKANQIIGYWPRYIKEGVMCVRYTGLGHSPTIFSIKEKHRTLLRMDDLIRPAIHVEVTVTDFDGYKITFADYQNDDAPILIVNSLLNKQISFCQKEDLRVQLLPPQYYLYYTWIDTFKPKELIVSSNGTTTTIQLNPSCGVLDKENEDRIYYGVFLDGPQTVLMFSSETSVIESVSDMPSTSESMKDYIQLSFHSIGLSVINDRSRDDLFYITINPSKELWTETRKFNVKPIGPKLNQSLEENYQKYIKQYQDKSNNKQIFNKFQIDKHRSVSFDGDIAEISNSEGKSVHVKRETLDGFWIGYAQSLSNQALHLRINHIQIDNQLEITLFPTVLYPIVSKAAATDIPGKPFIELSVFKSESTRSNTIHIKYFKLLIQEFVFRADQGFILGIMTFIQQEKNPAAPSIDMDSDIKYITNSLETLVRGGTDNTSNPTKIYFDDLHLSPLKIHVSFSMHGAKANEQLLAEYPIGDFLLQTLNVAEVQDVILKLNYYERKNDRYSIDRLIKEISDHYENQFLRQIHVVVLGLDVLGNPYGVIRGVAGGVESFFYEPYKGAMEGPMEFIEGIATGTEYLVGSVVGGAAGALSKISGAASKGLASITLDKDYQNARIQRKELQSQTTPEIVSSGKNVLKDIKLGVKGVVKKPVEGAKQGGTKGFIKGLGKGFLGLIGRPTSGIADLTSTSFNLIKRVAVHEQIMHRIRNPRHVGRDGLLRPSIANETLGKYIFDKFDEEKHTEHEGYIGHINSSSDPPTLFFATTKRILFLIGTDPSSYDYQIEWDYHYKDIKGTPTVKFEPNFIEITLKETNAIGMTKKDSLHVKVVPYESIGEARYIVDKIIETTNVLEV